MKKLILIALLFAACKSANHNGFYASHTDGTLEFRDTVLIEHTGFQKIRGGKPLPKEFKFERDHLLLNNTTYHKIK